MVYLLPPLKVSKQSSWKNSKKTQGNPSALPSASRPGAHWLSGKAETLLSLKKKAPDLTSTTATTTSLARATSKEIVEDYFDHLDDSFGCLNLGKTSISHPRPVLLEKWPSFYDGSEDNAQAPSTIMTAETETTATSDDDSSFEQSGPSKRYPKDDSVLYKTESQHLSAHEHNDPFLQQPEPKLFRPSSFRVGRDSYLYDEDHSHSYYDEPSFHSESHHDILPTLASASPSLPAPMMIMVEIPGLGLQAPLRGAQETTKAAQGDFVARVTCWGCQQTIHCIADCRWVLCPLCRSFSPNDHDEEQQLELYGVGLGVTSETLGSIQAEHQQQLERQQHWEQRFYNGHPTDNYHYN